MPALNGYLALGTLNGAGVFTEITGATGYARQAITFDVSDSGKAQNTSAVAFSKGRYFNWPKFNAYAFYSSASGGSPVTAWAAREPSDMDLYGPQPRSIGAREITVQFPASALPLTIGSVSRGVGEWLGASAPYLGQIASRCQLASAVNAGFTKQMSRVRLLMRDNVTSFKVVIPNWYVDPGTFVEVGAGASATITAAIEKTDGSLFTRITFNGQAQAVVANGANLVSDDIVLPVSIGPLFIRIYRECSAGIIYTGTPSVDSANGEAMAYNNGTTTDQTMGGTITATSAGVAFFPCAVIGLTRRPSILIISDSKGRGVGDSYSDNLGDLGEIARSVGPLFGYINASIGGDRAEKFVGSHTKRVELAQYCTDIVTGYGVNDITNNRTDAQLRADMTSIAGYFPDKRIWLTTITPRTTSTDSWATTGGQTAAANFSTAGNGIREVHNDWRRTTPAGFSGCFDVADAVESARNSGLWKPLYTADGTHETNLGYQAIRDANVVRTDRIYR